MKNEGRIQYQFRGMIMAKEGLVLNRDYTEEFKYSATLPNSKLDCTLWPYPALADCIPYREIVAR